MAAQCCCGRYKPLDEPIVMNGTLHEPYGKQGAFCGTVAAHRLAELEAELANLHALIDKVAEAVGWSPGDDLDLLMTAQELRDTKAALDLLESDEHLGAGLISDDFGNWAVSESGMQNISDKDGKLPTKEKPVDIASAFFVDADEWSGSIAEALRKFVEAGKEEN